MATLLCLLVTIQGINPSYLTALVGDYTPLVRCGRGTNRLSIEVLLPLWQLSLSNRQEESPQRATVPTRSCLLVTTQGINPLYSIALVGDHTPFVRCGRGPSRLSIDSLFLCRISRYSIGRSKHLNVRR